MLLIRLFHTRCIQQTPQGIAAPPSAAPPTKNQLRAQQEPTIRQKVAQVTEENILLRQTSKNTLLIQENTKLTKKLSAVKKACETAKRDLRAEKRRVDEASETRVKELERELEAEKRKSGWRA
jgi:predicted RNase H-like nuclease (RuvC/YqgF family)